MNYKDNLVEKVGGQSQFDFIVIKYCEHITADQSLKLFFKDMEHDSLIELQKEFLSAALLDLPSHITEVAMGRLVVNYQDLWESGLNERHFDTLKAHFIESLRDCWVEENLITLFDQHFDSLRPLFHEVSPNKKQIQEQVVSLHHHISSIAQRSAGGTRTNRLGRIPNGNART
ncbi:unnamed protein product [Cylindrotheca closterium]|uniref:Uncharacterized protein n=1 Tax=Cylindrotheca closterium TaxID=2856 RepID=A0AAD2FHN2_9STRA|nr:unnamed protein product [Cylindrotheca closterium]